MSLKFISMLKEIDIELSQQQLEQFDIYFRTLIEWNKKMNLTAITDEEDVYAKHFYDSLCLVKSYQLSNEKLLDVGSGAGFPSIPLKIVFPNIQVTIIDSLNKRITFLKELTNQLKLDVELIHGRAEEHNKKNHYDVVTARAVANLRMLGELCIPFVRKDGYFIAMKGPNYVDELDASKMMLSKLNAKVDSIVNYKLEENCRTIVRITKTKESKEKYPRKFSKIKSNPL